MREAATNMPGRDAAAARIEDEFRLIGQVAQQPGAAACFHSDREHASALRAISRPLPGSLTDVPAPGPWARRLKLLAGFITLQAMVQLVSSLSGFLLVRVLDKTEFGTYAIAASLQTILNILTDSGVGSGMYAVGGSRWQDRHCLGSLIGAALRLRMRLASFLLPAALLVAFALFLRNGLSWMQGLTLTAAVLASLWGQFNSGVHSPPLRLARKYYQVQRTELLVAILRLLCLGVLALLALNSIVAVTVVALSWGLQGLLLRRRCAQVADLRAEPGQDQTRQLATLVRKQFFSTCFFALQGQVGLWLMVVFGNAEKVADVGALGRLAVLFSLVSAVLSNLVGPAMARCVTLPRLFRVFAGAIAAYLAFAGILMLAVMVLPAQLLALLGAKYAMLEGELFWVVLSSLISGLTGVMYTLASSRGWIWHAWTIPFFTVALQIILFTELDLRSVRGVLLLGCISGLPTLLAATYMAARGLWVSRRANQLLSPAT